MSYYGTEDCDYIGRRRSPRTTHNELRHSAHYLNPEPEYSLGGSQYSGSHGHARTQFFNFYRDQVQDAKLGAETLYSSSLRPYQASPQLRGHRFGNEHVGDCAHIAPREYMRSGSRRRHEEVGFLTKPECYEWRLAQMEKEIEHFRRKQLSKEGELRKFSEHAQEKREAEDAEEEKKKRVIIEYEDKKRKAAERAKAEEIRIRERLEREKCEAKEKEERDWAEFLRKQKEKEEKENADKKEAEEKFVTEMRRRLAEFSYTEKQIDVLVDGERAKNSKQRRPTSPRCLPPNGALNVCKLQPAVYAKVHRDHLSVHTLIYFDIPYEHDKSDPNYIIILREMDEYETEFLFEHTRRLRARKLLLKAPKDRPQYAWSRKRNRSSSRAWRIGILEYRK